MRWLWDFDGTLASRSGIWSGALAQTLREEAPQFSCDVTAFRPHLRSCFPWHRPEQQRKWTSPESWWAALEPHFADAFMSQGVPADLAEGIARRVRRVYLDVRYWSVFDDVAPALDQLNSSGWSHAILSNHVPELDRLVEDLGLARHFRMVFSSAHIGFEKPHPSAYRHALDAIGPYQKVWMIGDSYEADVIGAENTGIPGVLVRGSHPHARYQCTSLGDIADIVGGA